MSCALARLRSDPATPLHDYPTSPQPSFLKLQERSFFVLFYKIKHWKDFPDNKNGLRVEWTLAECGGLSFLRGFEQSLMAICQGCFSGRHFIVTVGGLDDQFDKLMVLCF